MNQDVEESELGFEQERQMWVEEIEQLERELERIEDGTAEFEIGMQD